MNERDYKGYTLGQYCKNGRKTLYWAVELNGVEIGHDQSTLRAAKDIADHDLYKLKNYYIVKPITL
tara:strand:+ start:410 stop:607 length:198 start_codon:yes stop_codon:yes gene_type:complete